MADLQDLVRKKTTTKPKHTQSAFWGVESNSYGQPDIATNNSNVKIKLTLLKIVYIKNYREEKLIVWYGCVYYFKKIGGGGRWRGVHPMITVNWCHVFIAAIHGPCFGTHHGHGVSLFFLPSIATWGHGLLLCSEQTSLCFQVWLRRWAQTHLSPVLPAVKSSLWKWERRRLSHKHSASPSECE